MRDRRLADGLTFCIPNWNHRNFLARSIGTAYAAARALREIGVGVAA